MYPFQVEPPFVVPIYPAAILPSEPAVRGLLPSEFQDVVCNPFESLTTYLTDLAANIAKLSLTDNNTNTKAITDADNSTKALMTAAGCPTS